MILLVHYYPIYSKQFHPAQTFTLLLRLYYLEINLHFLKQLEQFMSS